jgi:hypothetical protein
MAGRLRAAEELARVIAASPRRTVAPKVQ